MELPPSKKGHTALLVVVDHATRMVIAATARNMTSELTAELLQRHVPLAELVAARICRVLALASALGA